MKIYSRYNSMSSFTKRMVSLFAHLCYSVIHLGLLLECLLICVSVCVYEAFYSSRGKVIVPR